MEIKACLSVSILKVIEATYVFDMKQEQKTKIMRIRCMERWLSEAMMLFFFRGLKSV